MYYPCCFLPDLTDFATHPLILPNFYYLLAQPHQALAKYGGERGIRTLDALSDIHDFQSCAFDHSAISPIFLVFFIYFIGLNFFCFSLLFNYSLCWSRFYRLYSLFYCFGTSFTFCFCSSAFCILLSSLLCFKCFRFFYSSCNACFKIINNK